MLQKLKDKISISAIIVLLVTILAPLVGTAHASGVLTSTSLRPTRMQASTNASLRLVFTTSATQPGGPVTKVVITFPAGYTVNATQTVSVAACPADTGATALPTSGTLAASGSGQVITITSVATLSNSTAYCVDLTSASAITNPSAGNYTATIATNNGATVVDTTSLGLYSTTNDNITVTAIVPPSFTMTLGGTTDSFASNLNPATPRASTGQTAQFITNATHGWTAWVENTAPAGLNSATAGHTIPTVATGSVTNLTTNQTTAEEYGLTAAVSTNGSGNAAIDTQYQGQTTSPISGGGLSAVKFLRLAYSTGVTNGDTITVNEVANAIATTPAAADYSDTLYFVGAGTF